MPNFLSESIVSEFAVSDPLTMKPNVFITSAMPLIPEPPIPMKCIFFILFFI